MMRTQRDGARTPWSAATRALAITTMSALIAVGCTPAPKPDDIENAPAEIRDEGVLISPSDGLVIADGSGTSLLTLDCNDNGVADLSEGRAAVFSLEPPVSYTTLDYPRGITSGDIDDDGDLDLAVVNYDADRVSVLLNDGDGLFSVHGTAPSVGNGPMSLASGDLDGDGDADLAVASHIADELSVLLSNGDGSFADAMVLADPPVELRDPRGVRVADLDGDGAAEVALVRYYRSRHDVILLWNAGDGTFDEHTLYSGKSAVAFADLDGDGDMDLMLDDDASSDIDLYENQGTRTLARLGTDFALGTLIGAFDLTGDGRPELLTGPEPIKVWEREEGSWWDHTLAFTEIGAIEDEVTGGGITVAVVDADNDGLNDIASLSAGVVRVFLNKGLGRFEAAREVDGGGGGAWSLLSADLDQRSGLDLALTRGTDDRVSVLLSGARLSRDANANGIPDECDIASGRSLDCNGNEIPDEADLAPVLSFSPRTFGIARSPIGYDPAMVALDLQHDGDMDLVVANEYEQEGLVYHFNRGAGIFGTNPDAGGTVPGFDWLMDVEANSIASGNFDAAGGNTLLDLALMRNAVEPDESPTVRYFGHHTTMGGFSSEWGRPLTAVLDERLWKLAAQDLDDDGNSDLVVVPYYSSGTIRFLTLAEGELATVGEVAVSDLGVVPEEPPGSVAFADMDGDGMRDLVFAIKGAAEVSICRNTGTAFSFSPCTPFAAGTMPVDVRTGDVDGDGLDDIVVANDYTNHASVLINTSDMALVPNTIGVAAPAELDLGNYVRMYPKALVLVDLDGDDDVDVATANSFSNNVSVLANDGSGAFARALIFPAGFSPEDAVATDVDGDQSPDLVVANGDGTLSVLINRSRPAVADDEDGDGVPDLCTTP